MATLRPWHSLPSEVAEALRPELEGVTDEIIATLRDGVPAYAKPLEGAFGRGVRTGVAVALGHFVTEIEAGRRVPRSDVYVDLGRGEARAGRSLESLLAAFRLGAGVAWRRFSEAGRRAGVAPETLYQLAEAIFDYIDELSAESAEGYALEQSTLAGAAQLRRRRLVRLLVREPAADEDVVTAAASDANWPLPRTLAVMVLSGAGREEAAARLPPDIPVDPIGDEMAALVPDPERPGRRAELERAASAGEALAALGPTVAWPDAPLSFSRARAALALARGGSVAESPLVVAAEHGAALLLSSDPRLVADLVRDRLAPLEALAPASRRRLTETLEAWLAVQGRLQAAADQLQVHPQTVRYRLKRLREILGGALDDPNQRFELDLALRTRAYLGGS
jgi:hypothetical protein